MVINLQIRNMPAMTYYVSCAFCWFCVSKSTLNTIVKVEKIRLTVRSAVRIIIFITSLKTSASPVSAFEFQWEPCNITISCSLALNRDFMAMFFSQSLFAQVVFLYPIRNVEWFSEEGGGQYNNYILFPTVNVDIGLLYVHC